MQKGTRVYWRTEQTQLGYYKNAYKFEKRVIILCLCTVIKFTELIVVSCTIQCMRVRVDDDDDKSWLVVYVRAIGPWRRGVVTVRSVEGTACRIQNDVWRHVVAAASSSIVTRSREWWMGGCHIYPATGGWMFFFHPLSLTVSLSHPLSRSYRHSSALYFSLYLI